MLMLCVSRFCPLFPLCAGYTTPLTPHITVKIPKPLLLADIIVRLQMTKNDVYTPLSRTGKSVSCPPSKTTAESEWVGEGQRGEELATAAEDDKVVCVCVCVCVCAPCVLLV